MKKGNDMESTAKGARRKAKASWFKVILQPSSFILGCALALGAHAQQYPTKPIRYIVGYTPAGREQNL